MIVRRTRALQREETERICWISTALSKHFSQTLSTPWLSSRAPKLLTKKFFGNALVNVGVLLMGISRQEASDPPTAFETEVEVPRLEGVVVNRPTTANVWAPRSAVELDHETMRRPSTLMKMYPTRPHRQSQGRCYPQYPYSTVMLLVLLQANSRNRTLTSKEGFNQPFSETKSCPTRPTVTRRS